MEDKSLYRQILWLFFTAIVAATLASAVWLFLNREKDLIFGHTIDSYKGNIESLEQQLAWQANINNNLIENLTHSQQARLEAETKLGELSRMLTDKNDELTTLKTLDWESKYQNILLDNETLIEKIATLEFQHALEKEEMDELKQFMEMQFSFLSEDFILMEFEYEELANEYGGLQKIFADNENSLALFNESLAEDLIQEEFLNWEREKEILGLKLQNKNYQKRIAKLEEASKKIEQAALKPSDTLESKKKVKSDKQDDYRLIRLQSLQNAMIDRDSEDRKQILINVIPTLPDGITAAELSNLVSGMDSGDILTVIQSISKHISRPLDKNTLASLSTSMNKKDAATATRILVNSP